MNSKTTITSGHSEITEKQLDAHLRHVAGRMKLTLTKSRKRTPTEANRGLYRLSDPMTGTVYAGEKYEATLSEVEALLSGDAFRAQLEQEREEYAASAPQIAEAAAGSNDPTEAATPATPAREDCKTWYIRAAAFALVHGLVLSDPEKEGGDDCFQLKDFAGDIVAGSGYTLSREQVIAEIESRPEVKTQGPKNKMPDYLLDALKNTDQLTGPEIVDVLTWMFYGDTVKTTAAQSLKDYLMTSDKISMNAEARSRACRVIAEAEQAAASNEGKWNENAADDALSDDVPKYSIRQARMMIAGVFRFLIERSIPAIGNTEDLLSLFSEMNQVLLFSPEQFLNDEEERQAGC